MTKIKRISLEKEEVVIIVTALLESAIKANQQKQYEESVKLTELGDKLIKKF